MHSESKRMQCPTLIFFHDLKNLSKWAMSQLANSQPWKKIFSSVCSILRSKTTFYTSTIFFHVRSFTSKRISPDCPFKTVWHIQNVLKRIWIPIFKLMRIQLQIPLRIRIQTCLARDRKLFLKNLHLISELGICSFTYCSFDHLLRSLKSYGQLLVICSDHSGQKSNCEQIAQVTHVKRATVSELLKSLMTNERLWAICSGWPW